MAYQVLVMPLQAEPWRLPWRAERLSLFSRFC